MCWSAERTVRCTQQLFLFYGLCLPQQRFIYITIGLCTYLNCVFVSPTETVFYEERSVSRLLTFLTGKREDQFFLLQVHIWPHNRPL